MVHMSDSDDLLPGSSYVKGQMESMSEQLPPGPGLRDSEDGWTDRVGQIEEQDGCRYLSFSGKISLHFFRLSLSFTRF